MTLPSKRIGVSGRPPRERVRCDRCTLEFGVGPPGADPVWIVCPDCGVRFWHASGASADGAAITDIHEGRAHWAQP